MSEQIDWVGPPKRDRGRPKGDRPPLSSAERMRRLRERAREALDTPESEREGLGLSDQSDTALVELVREPLKAGRPFALAEVMAELVHRANARQAGKHPDREPVRLARWVAGAGWVEWEDSRSVTPIQEEPEQAGEVWSASTPAPEIAARAIRMDTNGASRPEIVAMLQGAGYAPAKSMATQLKKYMDRWRTRADVIAILDQGGEP